MKKVVCEICKGKKFQFIDNLGKKKIYECNKCGVMFQFPLPSIKELKVFYKDLYSGKNLSVSTEKAFERYNKSQEEGRIEEIEKIKKKGRLLDVGASSGFFLKALEFHKNWRGEGIEYSFTAVNTARKNGVKLIYGDIFNKNLKDEYYDVVTMHSVLEHLANPSQYLKRVNMKLKKGGMLVVSAPNVRSFEFFLYRVFHKKFAGFILEHVFYYTPASLGLLMQKNNFLIMKMTSRHHSAIFLPPTRPLIGWFTFPFKLLLEYTNIGGGFKLGNILYVYAKKIN